MRVRFNKNLCVVMVCLLVLPAVVMATPASGIIFNFVNRFTVATDQIHGHAGQPGWSAELEVQGESDFVQQDVALAPGGSTGWHSHPGITLVTIKSGTGAFYRADDPTCSPTIYPAGSAFVEFPSLHHLLINQDSNNNMELLVTYIVPKGSPTRVEQPQPSPCPF